MAPQTRRDIIKLAAVSSVGTAAASLPSISSSAAVPPPVGKQAPGFYRLKIGSFEVTSITDGPIILAPISMLATNAPEQELEDLFVANFLATDQWNNFTNLALVNTGQNLVLIDTGGGPFQPTTGRVVDNLREAGIDPTDIDTIILSHGHPDHVWGILDADTGEGRFPNATFYVPEAEWALWSNADNASSFPEDLRWLLDGAVRRLQPIAERVVQIKPGADIVPGLTTIDASGHTPGHIGVMIASGNDQLLCQIDTAVHAVVSFKHPGWHFAFDMDPEKAVATRRRVLDWAATDKLLVMGYHLPFPGIGHVVRDGQAYHWVAEPWRWEL